MDLEARFQGQEQDQKFVLLLNQSLANYLGIWNNCLLISGTSSGTA